nr:MAG TPA: hypothetical protein [Caudoviricetes sp.]
MMIGKQHLQMIKFQESYVIVVGVHYMKVIIFMILTVKESARIV